jgi:hypothetical protein
MHTLPRHAAITLPLSFTVVGQIPVEQIIEKVVVKDVSPLSTQRPAAPCHMPLRGSVCSRGLGHGRQVPVEKIVERIVEKLVPSTCERTVVKEVVDNSEIERLREQIKALELARDRERSAPPPPPQVVERVVTREVPVEKIVEKVVVKEIPVDRIVTVTNEVCHRALFAPITQACGLWLTMAVQIPVEKVVVQERVVERMVQVPGPERVVLRDAPRPAQVAREPFYTVESTIKDGDGGGGRGAVMLQPRAGAPFTPTPPPPHPQLRHSPYQHCQWQMYTLLRIANRS